MPKWEDMRDEIIDQSPWQERVEELPDGTVIITDRDFGAKECPKCGQPPLLYWMHTSMDIGWIPAGRDKIRMRTKHSRDARACYGCHPCSLYSVPAYTNEGPAEAAKIWNTMLETL